MHCVDHGDIGMLRQFFKEADILVPDDKGVGPKTEIAAYILQRLFFIQGFRREQDGLAAQQGEPFSKVTLVRMLVSGKNMTILFPFRISACFPCRISSAM